MGDIGAVLRSIVLCNDVFFSAIHYLFDVTVSMAHRHIHCIE